MTKLKTVELPNATTLSESAFYSCNWLENVIAPSVKEVQAYCFYDCNSMFAGSVRLPSCERIGRNAYNEGSPGKIILEGPTLCVLDGPLGSFNNNGLEIYVPANLLDQYKAATNWVQYADKIFPIPEGGVV